MTIFVLLSYFLVVPPTLPSNGVVVAQTFSDDVDKDDVCAEAKRQHAEAWMFGVAYQEGDVEGHVIRKPVDCIVHRGPDGKPRKEKQ